SLCCQCFEFNFGHGGLAGFLGATGRARNKKARSSDGSGLRRCVRTASALVGKRVQGREGNHRHPEDQRHQRHAALCWKVLGQAIIDEKNLLVALEAKRRDQEAAPSRAAAGFPGWPLVRSAFQSAIHWAASTMPATIPSTSRLCTSCPSL